MGIFAGTSRGGIYGGLKERARRAHRTAAICQTRSLLIITYHGRIPDYSQREKDFAAWYQDVVLQGDMAEPAEIVKGCMVIKPNGYAVWELAARVGRSLQSDRPSQCLPAAPDSAEFPRKEAEHVEGFSPELAVVTIAGGKNWRSLTSFGRPRKPSSGISSNVDPELSRPAAADQPVGQRDSLGNAHPHVPAHYGVPLAGGTHRARIAYGGDGGSAAHARRLRRRLRETCWPCRWSGALKTRAEKFAGAVTPTPSRR